MKPIEGRDGLVGGIATVEPAVLPDRLPWPICALIIGGITLAGWAVVVTLFRAIV
jgi:hypothetical protein